MTRVGSRPALSETPSRLLSRLAAVLLVLGAVLAANGSPANAQNGGANPEWLDAVNFYRATAGLPPVVDEPTWTARQDAHARYIVSSMQECEDSVHTEQLTATNGCPANPDATEDGALSGVNSDVLRTVDPFGSPAERIHGFMERPYHAQWILDPALERVAFGFATTGVDGSVTGDRTTYQAAAVLDVLSGRSTAVDPSVYPVVWPGEGTKIPASSFLDENPNPLANCPRSIAPTGLPIIIRFATAPDLEDDQIIVRADGRVLGRCWFTSATDVHRSHPSGNTLFIIPDDPLEPDVSYSVDVAGPVPVRTSFDVIGEPVATSFQVEPQERGIAVTWSPPFYDGGAPIQEYLIIAIDENGTGRQVTKPANQAEALIGDLDPGRYLVRVHARNAGNRRPAFSFEQEAFVRPAAVTTTTTTTTPPRPSTTAAPPTTVIPTTTAQPTTVLGTQATTTIPVAPTTAPQPTVTTPPTSSATTSTAVSATSAQPAVEPKTVPTVAATVVVAQDSADLPFTGAHERRSALAGLALALFGAALVLAIRIDRRPTPLPTDR